MPFKSSMSGFGRGNPFVMGVGVLFLKYSDNPFKVINPLKAVFKGFIGLFLNRIITVIDMCGRRGCFDSSKRFEDFICVK